MTMTALDYEEIRQLLARYAWAIDFGDPDAFVACFAHDGYFEASGLPDAAPHEGKRYTGHEELRAFVTGLYAGLQGHMRHCTSLPLIEGDGERATMSSYLFEFRPGVLPNIGLTMSGVYDDRLAKIDGRWVFTGRICRVDPQPQHRALTPTDILVTRFDERAGR